MESEPLLPAQDGLPSLATPRLALRPMRVDDAPDVFAYAVEPDVLRYTTGTTPAHVDETSAFLRGALSAPDTRMWAIQLRDDPIVIGAIELGFASPPVGSIHYALARPHWRRGLMTEAVTAVCDWAFASVPHMTEIRTSVVEVNFASARVLEKCGFSRIGSAREDWPAARSVTLTLFRRKRPG